MAWCACDEDTGRVTHVELKGKGLVGSIPSVLANLTKLEYLDMRTNKKIVRSVGLEPSEVHPTGELGLLDMTGQVHYTTKERCQQFLQHLNLTEKEQRAKVDGMQLEAKHGPDGPALWRFFEANDKFPAMQTGRWFQDEVDISKWCGVITKKITNGSKDDAEAVVPSRVVELKLGLLMWNKDGFQIDWLNEMVKANLASLDLSGCTKLTSFPDLSHLLPALKIAIDDDAASAAAKPG